MCSIRKMFLEISQNSQERNETLAQVFSCEFCEISKNIFFTEYLWTTAFKAATMHQLSIRHYLNHWRTRNKTSEEVKSAALLILDPSTNNFVSFSNFLKTTLKNISDHRRLKYNRYCYRLTRPNRHLKNI